MKRKAEQLKEIEQREEEQIIRRRIDFDVDSEDEEITFNNQAHKKRKLSHDMDELKVWIGKKFEESNEQTQLLFDNINENKARGIRNEADIQKIRESVDRIEMHIGVAPLMPPLPLMLFNRDRQLIAGLQKSTAAKRGLHS